MISPDHLLDPTTPSSLPGACVPATASTHAELIVDVPVFPGQLFRSFALRGGLYRPTDVYDSSSNVKGLHIYYYSIGNDYTGSP